MRADWIASQSEVANGRGRSTSTPVRYADLSSDRQGRGSAGRARGTSFCNVEKRETVVILAPFLSPVERGRGVERSETEWGSTNSPTCLRGMP
jgi:hypothetical protein